MTKYKNIIFDFDGTIGDTFNIVIDIINTNKDKFGIDGISQEEIPRLKSLSARYLLEEFNINLLNVPKFLSFIKKELAKKSDEIKPFAEMVDVIKELKHRGYNLGVVTTNYVKNVTDMLRDDEEKLFAFIFTAKSLFGKASVLKKALKDFNMKPAETIYIGDEVRDIEAAKASGLDIIAVSWGYNSADILQKEEPTYFVTSPRRLLDILL